MFSRQSVIYTFNGKNYSKIFENRNQALDWLEKNQEPSWSDIVVCNDIDQLLDYFFITIEEIKDIENKFEKIDRLNNFIQYLSKKNEILLSINLERKTFKDLIFECLTKNFNL